MGFLNSGRRRDGGPPPTQDILFIRGLTESGVAIMADGTLSRMIEVGPIDMTMKDAAERERIYAWYTDWIRNLRHPTAVQIVIASTPQDISPWLERLRQKRDDWETMAEQAHLEGDSAGEASAKQMAAALAHQISFIEEAHARVRPLVDRYFVTVFYNPFPALSPGLRPARGKRNTLDPETFQKAEAELDRRVRRVADGLARVAEGSVTILNAHQVAAVVGDFYRRFLSPAGTAGALQPRVRLAPSLAAGLESAPPEIPPTAGLSSERVCGATPEAGGDWT
ncbi:MAG: hypothetical protein H8E35_16645 [Ardenticatenia bacterium]|nr:hypothetical protein [Ardenticatenia bacterium]